MVGREIKTSGADLIMMNQTQTPWNMPQNYKRTRKKKYEITACMPPEGTRVFNKLEQSHYITSNEKQFVLIGTVGEQWVIDVNKLCSTYTLADGRILNKDVLTSMVKPYNHNGVRVPVIGKFKVATRPGPYCWAMRVPLNCCFQIPTSWGDMLTVNAPGVPHGRGGDYLVCSDGGGIPNLGDRWVVNGAIFPDTYDMRPFSGKKKPASSSRASGLYLKGGIIPSYMDGRNIY